MTTGLITGFSSISELTNVVSSSAKTTAENGMAFSDALKSSSDKQSEKVEVDKAPEQKKNDNVKSQDSDAAKEDVKAEKPKETVKETEEVKDKEEVKGKEDVSDDVLAAAAQMLGAVSDILDVVPQKVEEALDSLGLTEVALLDNTKIPEIVVEVTDAEDTMAIMTDENLYADVKDITNQISEIIGSLEADGDATAEEIKEEITKFGAKEEIPELVTEVDNNKVAGPELVVAKNNQKEEPGNGSEQSGQMNWTESVVDNIKAAAAEQSQETTTVYSTSMEEIYEQVSESMKLNLTEEVTEMEINLHPASLGNVRVQIAAKDGVVTANFTAQNETVRAALETQLIQLKENMTEQGIKVEAIEVTVATHAFEENLSKEGESRDANQQTNKKRRSININELAEDDDIYIDDAEAIARDMMVKNGNTVDYMA